MNEKKKLQPKVRFREFTGENAPDWEQRKLGEIAKDSIGGGTPKTEVVDYWDGNLPWIQSSDLLEHKLDTVEIKKKISYKGLENSAAKLVPANSIAIVTRVGVGKLAIIPFDYSTSQDILSLCYLKINKFFAAYLIYRVIQRQLKFIQGTSIKGITKSELLNFNLLLPESLSEQECIGNLLKKIDKLITLHQRKLEQLEQLKNTLLSKMFPKSGTNIPEIRFSGFTDAWKQRKLGSVGTTYTGLSGKTADDFGHGDAHFITYINVFSNPIVNPNLVDIVEIDNKQHEVKIGDVFFTTSSETPGEVGMSSVLKEKHGITYLNSFCFGFRPNVKFDLDYLAYMLRSKHTRKQITLLAQGISRFNISKNKMMDINIYVPTIDEQAKIGACFYSVNKHITIHQRKLEQLKNLKQTLLNKMFI